MIPNGASDIAPIITRHYPKPPGPERSPFPAHTATWSHHPLSLRLPFPHQNVRTTPITVP